LISLSANVIGPTVDTPAIRRKTFGLNRTSEVAMPARKAKPRSTKVGTKGYDNKLYRKFENDRDSAPEDRDFMREFYYRRRHLATGISPNGNFRTLKYKVEVEEIKWAVHDGLKAIKERESAEIVKEVSSDLLFDVLHSIEFFRGGLPKSWRNLLN
jgi:hypothetical protein